MNDSHDEGDDSLPPRLVLVIPAFAGMTEVSGAGPGVLYDC